MLGLSLKMVLMKMIALWNYLKKHFQTNIKKFVFRNRPE